MNGRGFSLVETLLAMSLLCFVVVAVLQLMPGSSLAARRAQHGLEATLLGQSMIESMRTQAFGSLQAWRGQGWLGGSQTLTQVCPTFTWPRPAADDGVQLVARCRIDSVAGSDPTRLLHLTASVRWAERAALRLAQDGEAGFALQAAPDYREYLQELTVCVAGP